MRHIALSHRRSVGPCPQDHSTPRCPPAGLRRTRPCGIGRRRTGPPTRWCAPGGTTERRNDGERRGTTGNDGERRGTTRNDPGRDGRARPGTVRRISPGPADDTGGRRSRTVVGRHPPAHARVPHRAVLPPGAGARPCLRCPAGLVCRGTVGRPGPDGMAGALVGRCPPGGDSPRAGVSPAWARWVPGVGGGSRRACAPCHGRSPGFDGVGGAFAGRCPPRGDSPRAGASPAWARSVIRPGRFPGWRAGSRRACPPCHGTPSRRKVFTARCFASGGRCPDQSRSLSRS